MVPNYVGKLALQISMYADDCPQELLWLYALIGLVKGVNVSARDVHDAWAVWRTVTKPDHADLIPFEELTTEMQNRDIPYRDAIILAVKDLGL